MSHLLLGDQDANHDSLISMRSQPGENEKQVKQLERKRDWESRKKFQAAGIKQPSTSELRWML